MEKSLLGLNKVASILEKIQKVEALIERAGTEGERQAAIHAKERLDKLKPKDEVEYTIRTNDLWHKKLFAAICHKYKLDTYRYYRQKYTTVMVRISKELLDEVIWPEYLKYSEILEDLVDEITAGVISKIHKDETEIVIQGDIEYHANENGSFAGVK